ncbi:MAG: 4-hydroxythreonine-4-phosphate dehydrogenase PdxA [Thermodesulfobacteriaceae bacterium]|nr:4-hydroxythreonine-4-phosphate dehydrogenase PdxA [Thermodesulfobacteriaceae bacterium]MDW8135385.1 4-hydroxythreonine-4-phosphate dehydrogenase PdxA [Thermodesulfobacterium sp.]
MSSNFKIGISLGCPAGIGPEVILKSLFDLKKYWPNLLIIGDKRVLQDTSQRLKCELPPVEILSLSALKLIPGKPTIEGYKAMGFYFQTAIELAKRGEIQAIVTAPISKEGLNKAGFPYSGHTDWLAKEFQVKDYVMCFYGKKLIVSLVTIHIPLKEVPLKLNSQKILKVCELSYEFLKKVKRKGNLKIALCGLNPHAGEGGLLGEEEKTLLEPALRECEKRKIPVSGPYPADSLFYWAYKGRFDLVVSLYHDQGLSPFKLVHFEDGVNVTLGLPIVRTSPCHGTAYDLAGKGLANPKSFLSAVKLAIRLVKNN